MPISEEERLRRSEAAKKRAARERKASLKKEREFQARLKEDDYAPEAWRAITYCNSQLLNERRASDWPDLRYTRDIHFRQGRRSR